VIPAFNEADNIARTLGDLQRVLKSDGIGFELIVVDDGSRDPTSDQARRAAEGLGLKGDAFRLLRHPANRGYGAALTSGFREARREWVLLYPGDGQFDVAEIGRLKALASAEQGERPVVVWPYRQNRAEGWRRVLNAALYRLLIRAVLGVAVRDIDCGMKLYERRLFAAIPPLTSAGALIDAEILFHCRSRGVRVVETSVHHLPRRAGAPTGANWWVILRMFRELLRFRLATWTK
jgi:dolichol-phosphate mannosyltransferase